MHSRSGRANRLRFEASTNEGGVFAFCKTSNDKPVRGYYPNSSSSISDVRISAPDP